MLTRKICFFFFFLIFICPVSSAENYALLVGINNYPDDISPLRYCVADVLSFRDELINLAGFKRDKILLMTDDTKGNMEPTHINIIMQLGLLAKQIQPPDTFIFYFSGHGIANEVGSFLLSSNSNIVTQDTLEMSAVPLDRVNKILSSLKAQQLLVIIDACRNNPEANRGIEDNFLTDNFSKGFQIHRRNLDNHQPRVSAIFYACNVGERAYEWPDKGHGVFSYYLLQGLKGEAANEKGEVTITDLADYTQNKVLNWAKTYRGKKQTPWLNLTGETRLVLVDKIKPRLLSNDGSSVTDPELEAWKIVKDSANILDFEDFLSVFPDGDLSDVVRLKIKKLERVIKPQQVTKPLSQQIQAELDLARQRFNLAKKNNDTVAQVIYRQKEAQLLAKLRQAEAKEKLEKQRNWHNSRLRQPYRTGSQNQSDMVLIPAGPATLSFYLDKYEVTNAQYNRFVQETGHRKPYYWDDEYFNQPNQPVVGVSWYDASAYARWINKRLPSENEWEWAARGGLKNKQYPWGNQEPNTSRANYGRDVGKSSPVGSYPANGYGLYDMAGNVWEWCHDWFSLDRDGKVVRGGSWYSYTYSLSVENRNQLNPDSLDNFFGFRCASESN